MSKFALIALVALFVRGSDFMVIEVWNLKMRSGTFQEMKVNISKYIF